MKRNFSEESAVYGSQRIYAVLEDYRTWLPERFDRMFNHMQAQTCLSTTALGPAPATAWAGWSPGRPIYLMNRTTPVIPGPLPTFAGFSTVNSG